MHLKKLITLLVFLSYSIASNAAKADPKINAEMKGISQHFKDFIPYLSSLDVYRSRNNEKRIEKNLDTLVKKFGSIEKHLSKKKLNYKVSKKVMLEHLKETRDSFKTHKAFSYRMAKGIPGLCIHCHAHDGKRPLFGNSFTRSDFKTDFEFAEFNHMTRNYAEALKYYDKSIEKHKGDKAFNTSEALKRQLSLYVMSLNKPERALNYLEKINKDKKIDFFSKSDLKEWINGLQEINKKKKAIDFKLTKKNLEKNIIRIVDNISDTETLISDEKDRVLYLVLQRKLNDFLNNLDSEYQVPVVLYWLSFVERKLNYNLFYSFADILLKECMVSYTKHPYAKKCFQEYKNQMVFSFTGSSGEHMPEDVKKELLELKNMIYKN